MTLKLGFGTQRMPLLDAGDDRSVDVEQVCKMVDAYIEAGGRYFDVARPYHGEMCETVFRKAVAERYPRDAYEVTGKFTAWKTYEAGGNEQLFQSQLEACGVDRFDMYMYHALNPERCEEMDRIGGWDFVQGLLRDGRIGHIGLQFHDGADTLEWILDRHPEIETVHFIFNYAEWDSPLFELERCHRICKDHDCDIITMYPIMQGALVDGLTGVAKQAFKDVHPDWTPVDWALRWAASIPEVKSVLVDASSLEQMEQNIATLKDFTALDEREIEAVRKVRRIMKDAREVPCTWCGECQSSCPKNLDIAKYIELYDDQKAYGMFPALHKGLFYGTLVRDHGTMSECVDCDACAAHCPEGIDIPSVMHRATQIFDHRLPRPATPYDRFPIGETEAWDGSTPPMKVSVYEF